MSQIDQLIAELAPAGVEFKALGEVLRIKNGKDHKALGDGDVPVYGSGGIMRHADTAAAMGPSVLIPRKGSLGNLFYVEGPFWVVDTIFRTEIDTSQVEPKFVYYKLLTMGLGEMNQAGGVPSQTQSVLNLLRIPVPPLPVQREIVRILDQFTQLEAELEAGLEAELEARRVQYEFYRDSLLTFPVDTPIAPLGELGTIFGGLTGKSKADFSGGNARYATYTNVFNNIALNTEANDFVRVGSDERQRSLAYGDVIFTGSSESLEEVGMTSVVTRQLTEPLYLNSFCIGFRLNDGSLLNPEFAKHLFRSGPLRAQIIKTANGVTRINVSKVRLAKILVPLPPMAEQERIARILDRFDALTGDLRIGLPAEIAARRKQYEHYRDQLLTFEEAAA